MHPRLLEIGHFILPTYGVLLALGLVLALLVCLRVAKLLALNTDKVANLAMLSVAVTLAGAKLLLAALHWQRYGIHALAFSLVNAGDAVFGGTAAAILICWGYARKVGLPVLRTADALAPALAVGSSIASIACFEYGCGYGTPTTLPWAAIYTSPFVAPGTPLGVPLHPTQIYASLAEYMIFVVLLWLLRRPHHDGEVMGAWLYLSGICRFFLSYFRGDEGRPSPSVFTLRQTIAIGMVLFGGLLWLRRGSADEAPDAA